jgi:hypothetical protein
MEGCSSQREATEDISLADIRTSCVTMAKKHPDKPPVFFETDLSRLAYALPRTDHWWIPLSDKEKHSQGLLSIISTA